MGDLGARAEGAAERRLVELRWEAVDLLGEVQPARQRVARDRRLEQSGRAREVCRPLTDLVDPDVVAVPVAPVAVVGEQHVCRLLAQQGREPSRRLLQRRPHEPGAPRRVGRQLRPEAAVGIAQPLHPRHAQGGGGGAQLGKATFPQAAVTGIRGGGKAEVAVGGDHEPDPVALGGCARQGPGGEQRLVVGVGVERQEGAGHHRPSSRMAGSCP